MDQQGAGAQRHADAAAADRLHRRQDQQGRRGWGLDEGLRMRGGGGQGQGLGLEQAIGGDDAAELFGVAAGRVGAGGLYRRAKRRRQALGAGRAGQAQQRPGVFQGEGVRAHGRQLRLNMVKARLTLRRLQVAGEFMVKLDVAGCPRLMT
ncbi:hypothetical protein D3C72_850770 [compost metagenome]